jgi:hypothetical protein
MRRIEATMPSPEELRAKAREYLRLASESTESVAITLLRMLADDYFALANAPQPITQQQQQIQPKEPESDDK